MTTTIPNARGRLAGRFLKSLALARGNYLDAAAFAGSQRWSESEAISEMFAKGAVTQMGPDDSSAIFAAVAQDLAAVAAPLSVYGRLSGFRRVPPMTALATQLTAATAYWGDLYQNDGAATPVSKLSFSRVEKLVARRVSAIVVVTQELARSSDAENVIGTDLGRAMAAALDSALLNPTSSGSPATSPASVTSSGRIF